MYRANLNFSESGAFFSLVGMATFRMTSFFTKVIDSFLPFHIWDKRAFGYCIWAREIWAKDVSANFFLSSILIEKQRNNFVSQKKEGIKFFNG